MSKSSPSRAPALRIELAPALPALSAAAALAALAGVGNLVALWFIVRALDGSGGLWVFWACAVWLLAAAMVSAAS